MSKLLWAFEQGGIIMYPLVLISVLSLAVMVERAIRLQKHRMFSTTLIEAVQNHLEAGRMSEAMAACKGKAILVARVFEAALNEFVHTKADIETSFQECGQRELTVLSNNLAVLRTVSRIAPLMGLLGTVMGMIGAFEVLSEAGVGKEEMAGQIRVALITTATGLIIAIPTVIADAFYRARIRKITAQFESVFIDVIKSVRIGTGISAAKSGSEFRAEPKAAVQVGAESGNTSEPGSGSESGSNAKSGEDAK